MRVRAFACALAVFLAAACTGATDAATSGSQPPLPSVVPRSDQPTTDPGPGRPRTPAESACALPEEQLLRVWRGSRVGPSGSIQIVPAEPNYVGSGFSHAGPWDYVQEIPLFVYGPGFVRATGALDRPATLVDIAPTQAELLGFPFDPPDGTTLHEALVPAAERTTPPRLIVTLVWDGAGRNVLDTWSRDWPTLRGMIPDGAWYDRATIGSSPSNTPPTHASIGTGAWPRRHGILDLFQRIDGDIVKPHQDGPAALRLPTLADTYDAAMGNEPKVGLVATLAAHTGMVGHGASWPGGDRDVALMRELESAETGGAEGLRWQLTSGMAPSFRMPSYVNALPGIEQDVRELDRADGRLDGRWGKHPFSQLQYGFQTPARVPYQMRIVREIIAREGFGADDVPDLLFINVKAADAIGHLYSVNGPEMGQTVQALDASLVETIRMLDELVGEGRWVLFLTADHGHQYDPAVSGASVIGVRPLATYLEERLGGTPEAPIVKRVRPTQIWVDERTLAANGLALDDVAMAVMDATQADVADEGVVPSDPRARAFSAAFPTSGMSDLPCLRRAT